MTSDTLRAVVAAHKQAVHEAMSPWCNAKTAAAYLGVSESQIWKMKRSGKLRGYGIEGQHIVRFKREELDRMMSQWIEFRGQTFVNPIITINDFTMQTTEPKPLS